MTLKMRTHSIRLQLRSRIKCRYLECHKEGLPLTKDGKQVRYYVVENGTASGYEAAYSHTSDNAVSLNQDKAVTVTVTNTYTQIYII